MKKSLFYFLTIIFLLIVTGCSADSTANTKETTQEGTIKMIDDLGKTIMMPEPAGRIISLYSAHTENLFSLGLDDQVIGVYKTDSYPPGATTKDVFDYRSDPEKVIAVNPDMVLIRPFINESHPDFVKALENAGINVVCLYPDQFEDFGPYIKKLAKLTGREKEAEKLLYNFNRELNDIASVAGKIKHKKQVFFESTEREYRTITNDCMAANAIRISGGINIASDAVPVRKGSSIASYGLERILDRAGDIDVYVAQRGAMNSGVNPDAIRTRPGFNTIKAVKENRIYTIDEKLVSSPTFRYATGVRKLAGFLYPEIRNTLDERVEKLNESKTDLPNASSFTCSGLVRSKYSYCQTTVGGNRTGSPGRISLYW